MFLPLVICVSPSSLQTTLRDDLIKRWQRRECMKKTTRNLKFKYKFSDLINILVGRTPLNSNFWSERLGFGNVLGVHLVCKQQIVSGAK